MAVKDEEQSILFTGFAANKHGRGKLDTRTSSPGRLIALSFFAISGNLQSRNGKSLFVQHV
jgi:hypothetical protein